MENDNLELTVTSEFSLKLAILDKDKNIYSLFLENNDVNAHNIRQLSVLMNVNFIKARDILRQQNIKVLSGGIYKLFSILNKLNEMDLIYRIIPDFPYDKTLFKDITFFA